ncbi:hypothetical protein ANCCAN_11397 [Ancylostoma caninum]|uniref:Uncharacterized protein n=1 Tax=Ancylostoma caninum TaxID=29170 RepID=A0A368GE42_ANCCA|nr:hypothetical protein ANCCAN_11397 [Ancylostoma caninum]
MVSSQRRRRQNRSTSYVSVTWEDAAHMAAMQAGSAASSQMCSFVRLLACSGGDVLCLSFLLHVVKSHD